MRINTDEFFAVLSAAGMPEVPYSFSVAPLPHLIPRTTMAEIDAFLRIFERVTTSAQWQDVVTSSAPEIARAHRSEVCFFTAWDFHLSPGHGWQLIECNDNGSGFFYASLINRLFYELSQLRQNPAVTPPASIPMFTKQLVKFVEREGAEFFGTPPDGLFVILEAADALRSGKFYHEFLLLRDLFRRHGWQTEIVAPGELHWDGHALFWNRQKVSFVVNRSTDFFWQAEVFSALRTAYLADKVYVAPNPFTYATRSDKRLLEFLSSPQWDQELGIRPEERAFDIAGDSYDLIYFVMDNTGGKFAHRQPKKESQLIEGASTYEKASFAERPVILKLYGDMEKAFKERKREWS